MVWDIRYVPFSKSVQCSVINTSVRKQNPRNLFVLQVRTSHTLDRIIATLIKSVVLEGHAALHFNSLAKMIIVSRTCPERRLRESANIKQIVFVSKDNASTILHLRLFGKKLYHSCTSMVLWNSEYSLNFSTSTIQMLYLCFNYIHFIF